MVGMWTDKATTENSKDLIKKFKVELSEQSCFWTFVQRKFNVCIVKISVFSCEFSIHNSQDMEITQGSIDA